MATKKLRAELDVDTTKAKQKVRDLSESGGGAAGGDGVGSEAGRAGKELRELGNSAKEAGAKLGGIGKMMAGIGLSMARSALSAGGGAFAGDMVGNAAQAFSMGATAGGAKGGAAAALASIGLTWIDAENKELDKMNEKTALSKSLQESYKSWDEARSHMLAFKKTMEELTSAETDLTARQQRITEEIRKREEADEKLQMKMSQAAFAADPAAFNRAVAERNRNAAEIDQLRALEKQRTSSSGGGASWNAADSLSSVGGMFAGSGAGGRALDDIASSAAETVKVLKNIDRNTQGGGATWQ